MSAPIAFVDCETTGLDPDVHAIWEVGLITPDGAEHVWQFPVDEMTADPFALNIGRYWDRRWGTDWDEISPVDAIYEAHTAKSRRKNFPDQGRALAPSPEWARHFQRLTAGCHLAGAVVSFDEERLRRLLHRLGVLHRWHYHLCDVEALAAGSLAGFAAAGRRGLDPAPGDPAKGWPHEPPWDSDELSHLVGVDPAQFERHSALGDAKFAKALFDAVMGGGS